MNLMNFKQYSLSRNVNYNPYSNLNMGTVCFRVEQQKILVDSNVKFFDLKANDITGRRIDFYIYKNRSAFLIVNVASKCKLAQVNYQFLNEMCDRYKDHGLEIMAFPCNQFGQSQPKNGDELLTEIRNNYNPKFTIFQKIQVNGPDTHPVYKYLRSQSMLVNNETKKSKRIPQNFSMCLLNKEGQLFRFFKPSKKFDDLKQSLKRTLTHEKLSTKQFISLREIKN